MRALTVLILVAGLVRACSNIVNPTGSVTGNGSTDDAAAIQAQINANAGCTIEFTGTNTYLIGTHLTIPNHTHLLIDSGATIKRKASTLGTGDVNLITNANWTGNYDITIDGAGTLDGNKANETQTNDSGCSEPSTSCIYWAGVSVEFINVKWLRVTGITIKDPVSFGFLLSSVQHVEIGHIAFSMASPVLHNDGIDVFGGGNSGVGSTTSEVWIHDLTGTCGDDVVAILADDVPANDPTTGDINTVVVQNVNVSTPWNGVKLLVNSSHISGVLIEGLSGGSYATNGSFGGVVDLLTSVCASQAGTISNIQIDTSSATAATGIFLDAQAVSTAVTYSNISGGSTTVTTTGGCSSGATSVSGFTTIPGLTLGTRMR